MFQAIKNFFIGSTHEEVMQASGYRARRYGFNGEKQSGGLNYTTAHQVDRQGLIRRSIKAFEESTQARSAINRLNDSVINTGLMLESTPVAPILGITDEQKQEISNQIEARFNLWANDRRCDAAENNTLGQIERILFNNQLIKGDYFVVLDFSDDPGLFNPLQIKIINPDRVSTPTDQAQIKSAEERGNKIVSGIEIDDNGKSIAIYVKFKNKKTFKNEWKRIEVINQVTGRQVVIHGNKQRFGDEIRGIPVLAHIAHELEKVTDYGLLELMSAVANASIASVVKPSENAPATNPFTSNSFVPPNLQKTIDGYQATDADQNLDSGYTNIGKNVLKNSGGLMVSSLNAGEDLISYDTKRPNVNYTAFVDGVSKYLSASLNIPIEVLTMLFGSNFSASRASLKLFWQSIMVWRDEIISDFRRPVHSAFLLGEVGTGNLILPGYDNPALRPAWESANFIGIPSPSIDPVKEAKGAAARIKEGITTREQEQQKAGNRSGFDSTISRLTAENEKLAAANRPITEQEKGVA
jgi:lambda family phage portal protein